jgi:hypothetical protein
MSSIAQALTDKDFLNAHPDDQKKYLSSIDQDFAKGSPQDQQAYLNHILEPQRRAQSAQPTQFENNAPKVPDKYGFTVSNVLKSGIQGVKDVGHFAKEAASDISNPNKPLFFGGAESGPKESTFHKYVVAPSERENEKAQQGGQGALESIGHSVAAAIPGIGPWVSSLAERAGTGDVGGAAAQGAAQYFTGKGLEKIGSKATSATASGLPMIGKTVGEVIGEESLKLAASLALRSGNSVDPACCVEVVQRSKPAMVRSWTRTGARCESDVHLEAHSPVQGRQAECPLAALRCRHIRGTRAGARIGQAANS